MQRLIIMISFEETKELCEVLEIEIEQIGNKYYSKNKNIKEYLKEAITCYGEKLYLTFHRKPTTDDLEIPPLYYSSIFNDWYTFKYDGKEITKIEFASGVVYEKITIEGFLKLPQEDKKKFYMLSKAFI